MYRQGQVVICAQLQCGCWREVPHSVTNDLSCQRTRGSVADTMQLLADCCWLLHQAQYQLWIIGIELCSGMLMVEASAAAHHTNLTLPPGSRRREGRGGPLMADTTLKRRRCTLITLVEKIRLSPVCVAVQRPSRSEHSRESACCY